MGFISNTTSFTRYRVKDPLPVDYKEKYPIDIRRHAFREIEDTPDIERSVGWVNIMNVMDSEFRGDEFFKNEFIALSLRIDNKKIPSDILKKQCSKTEEKRKTDLGREFISKEERQEIRETVKLDLLKRIIPHTSIYDMIWNLKTGLVFFSSLSDNLYTEFVDLFKKTFELNLHQLFPYSIAEDILKDDQKASLENIAPISFIPKISNKKEHIEWIQ
ncbi:MAG: recombination-associated protein RdgC [bacterium]